MIMKAVLLKQKSALKVFLNLLLIPLLLSTNMAHAANVPFNITANSGSPSPGMGTFSPSSISVNQGDSVTITFAVPADDPYCCGIQIKGDGGQFDTGAISPGATAIVDFTANSSFGFTSYWPGTGTIKAHGSVNVSTPTPTPPSTPTGVKATAISTSQIKLTWSSSSGATSYKIQRGGTTIKTVSGLEYTDSGLTVNTSYSYKVIAHNSDGDSAASSSVTAKTQAASSSTTTNTTNPSSSSNSATSSTLFTDSRNYYATIDGKAFSLDSLPDVTTTQKLVVFGTTVAKAQVNLSVDSTKIGSTVANTDGNWSLTADISKLSMGEHKAVLGLSANGQSSSKNFTLNIASLADAKKSQKNTKSYYPIGHTSKSNISRLLLYGGIGVTILVLMGGALYMLKFRKGKLVKPANIPSAGATPQTISTIPDQQNIILSQNPNPTGVSNNNQPKPPTDNDLTPPA